MQIANFFWHGNLSTIEISCISSFIKNDFIVNLWTYTDYIDKIPAVNYCDANLVLPKENITKYGQGHKKANLAAFSDVFRINLLNKYDGWWFDTDCYCLKHSNMFNQYNYNPITIGYQNQAAGICAVGAIRLTEPSIKEQLLNKLNTRLYKYNNQLPNWGFIGPELFTSIIDNNGLQKYVCMKMLFILFLFHNFIYCIIQNKRHIF